MTIISQKIQKLHYQCALIPFITAGDPSLKITAEAITAFDNFGADIIELGLPYSVPLADGPIIQAASSRALMHNINLDKILDLLKQVIKSVKTPIILFTYYNPVFSRNIFSFIQNIAYVGVQGILIPDLPLEESGYINYLCYQFNIELVFLVTPTSTIARIKKIVSKTSGCIYLVNRTGVTGIHKEQPTVSNLVATVKSMTYKPLLVGFGISTIEQIKNIYTLEIQGVVLGSIFVEKLSHKKDGISKISQFCQQIKQIQYNNRTFIPKIPPGEFESPLPP